MKIEDKLGETFSRAVADEPLPADVWASFERRARRSERVRYASAGLAFAAVVALAAVIVPRLGRHDERLRFAGTPTASAPESPSPSPGFEGRTFTQPDEHWSMKYPNGWEYMRFEGQQEFHPQGLSSLPKGEDTFAVALTLREEKFDYGSQPCPAPCEPASFDFDGHQALLVHDANGSETRDIYRVDWSAGCSTCPDLTLEVLVLSSSPDLTAKYSEIGRQILETIRYLG